MTHGGSTTRYLNETLKEHVIFNASLLSFLVIVYQETLVKVFEMNGKREEEEISKKSRFLYLTFPFDFQELSARDSIIRKQVEHDLTIKR